MDAKTLEALKASIAKWERNAVAKQPDDYRVGSGSCPLCFLFLKGVLCYGCPIFEAGFDGCEGTPYDKAYEALISWKSGSGKGGRARQYAVKEVAFLRSLLPAEEAP